MSPAPWNEGESLEEIELPPVSRLGLIKYAGASGDYNPIHTIDAEAEAAGLPGIIQHGMLTMAEMARLLTPHFQNGFIEHFSTRFTGMLFLDEVLVLGGTVTDVEEGAESPGGVRSPDGDAIITYTFDVYARTTEDRKIAKGSARFLWLGSG